jgi:hypothetical protein
MNIRQSIDDLTAAAMHNRLKDEIINFVVPRIKQMGAAADQCVLFETTIAAMLLSIAGKDRAGKLADVLFEGVRERLEKIRCQKD